MKRLWIILGISLLAVSGQLLAQDRLHDQELARAIAARTWVFHARTALPLNGRAIQLTDPGYVLTLMPDSLAADLPYFGRAYAAPLNPAEGGIHLRSGAYRYTSKTQKTGWHLTIYPPENPDVYRMDLHISTSGDASLQLVLQQRQNISYFGYITGFKEK